MRLASRLLWREGALWLLLTPFLFGLAAHSNVPLLEDGYNDLVLLCGCLVDMMISLAGERYTAVTRPLHGHYT